MQGVETKEDGSVEFEFASGKDVRPEVAKQVINSGYDLIELRPLGMSLEEIFLELTGSDIQKEIKRNSMRNIWTIAKREYDNYFNSPLAYVVAFAILLPMGIYFSLIMFVSSQQAMMGGPAPESTPINWLFVFLMIFLSPALTMRLLSDEARMGTLELLLTAPIRDFELVAGKWLGAFLFVLLACRAHTRVPDHHQ